MTSQRYTLTRTWQVPLGWTKTETASEAVDVFQEELDDLKAQGFRVLTPLEVEDAADHITFTCVLRGPVGYGYNDREVVA